MQHAYITRNSESTHPLRWFLLLAGSHDEALTLLNELKDRFQGDATSTLRILEQRIQTLTLAGQVRMVRSCAALRARNFFASISEWLLRFSRWGGRSENLILRVIPTTLLFVLVTSRRNPVVGLIRCRARNVLLDSMTLWRICNGPMIAWRELRWRM